MSVSRTRAAELLGVSLAHFKRHIQHELPVIYSGQRKLYPYKALVEWADRQTCREGRAA